VQQHGAEAVSVEAVATAAGSAKGLVHYHFKTKQGLLSAVAEKLASARIDQWQRAFDAPTAQDAVQQTWCVLTRESAEGMVRAWQSLVGTSNTITDGLANTLRERYASSLMKGFINMLRSELGLTPTVEEVEIGLLLEALVEGIGFQLTSGADERTLEGAYSAGWLAILSLTQPIS
jgi:AcrR family transcriptional regulator